MKGIHTHKTDICHKHNQKRDIRVDQRVLATAGNAGLGYAQLMQALPSVTPAPRGCDCTYWYYTNHTGTNNNNVPNARMCQMQECG